uniref:UDP-glucose 4-epimerase n=1 Tax=Candidatus Kentrum sp. FW TaxID=2126338 RepID=A0A450TNZ3_9GAMM|nr:MAG: UDP-glucose-4-epimerase GalE [Candidatus Kentron sp. FW]
MKVLLTGGAGYIGSHAATVLIEAGLDAAGESFDAPLDYYANNVEGAIGVPRAMAPAGIRTLVFSSSASVYGHHRYIPLDDGHPTEPVNPYARSKLHVEEMLWVLANSGPGWRIACLRYFNAAGAHPSGIIGENPRGAPNNPISRIARTALGELPHLNIFGNDYRTADGTAVRDYIHVMDLAGGHLAALNYLMEHTGWHAVNLGTDKGYSVMELIGTFERARGVSVPRQVVTRRAGDVAACHADVEKAATEFGWRATRTMEEICRSVWRFQKKRRVPPSVDPRPGRFETEKAVAGYFDYFPLLQCRKSVPDPASTTKKTVVVHVGTSKTGSTSLQTFFHNNREALRVRGVAYPSDGAYYHGNGHHVLARVIKGKEYLYHWIDPEDPAYSEERCIRQIRRHILDNPCPVALLSAEEFWHPMVPPLLGAVFDGLDVRCRIIAYVRRQDQWLLSDFNQRVKTLGYHGGGFEDFVREEMSNPNSFYRHYPVLSGFARVFGKQNVTVRVFERSALGGGALFQDFLSLLGQTMGPDLAIPESENTSIPWELIYLIQQFNSYSGLGVGERLALNRQLRQLTSRMDFHDLDPLSPELRREILSHYRADNALVAREFLGREDGRLFTCPENRDSEVSGASTGPHPVPASVPGADPVREAHSPDRTWRQPPPVSLDKLAKIAVYLWRANEVDGQPGTP